MIVCAGTARFVFSLSVGSPCCVTRAAFPRCIGAVCLSLSSSANSADNLKLQQLASHATLGSVSVGDVKEFFGSQSGLEALEHTQCSVPTRKPKYTDARSALSAPGAPFDVSRSHVLFLGTSKRSFESCWILAAVTASSLPVLNSSNRHLQALMTEVYGDPSHALTT